MPCHHDSATKLDRNYVEEPQSAAWLSMTNVISSTIASKSGELKAKPDDPEFNRITIRQQREAEPGGNS